MRKTGKYELDNENKKDIGNINDKLEEYKKRVKILENNQKKEKYPEGGYIYIIQPPNQEDHLYKVGKTNKKLNKRLNTYNTTIPDNVVVVDKVKVKSPIPVELCVKSFLYDFRYRNNKEYYQLELKDIKKVINECNELVCGSKKILKRQTKNKFSHYYRHFFFLLFYRLSCQFDMKDS